MVIKNFLTRDGLVPVVRRVRFILRELAVRFIRNGELKNAAALTYTTLFAVVPLMTVMYAAFSLIPQFQSISGTIQAFVFDKFVPTSGAQVLAQLQAFSDQARHLSGWGAVFLFVTSYLLLLNVEEAFNDIWGVVRQRRGVARFLLYWAVLTFGPPALAAAIAISSLLLSLPLLSQLGDFDLRTGVLAVLPWLISGAGFSFLFYAVPNCPVRFSHALIGGVLTMACFHGALALFALVMRSSSLEVIYGTFAAVPLFLSWIYLCWCMVLGGALVVKILGEPTRERHLVGVPALVAALQLLRELALRHEQGRGMAHEAVLSIIAPARHGVMLLARLQDRALIARSDRGEWLLGRDLQKITLWDLSELVTGEPGWSGNWAGVTPALAARLDAAVSAARAHLDISLDDVVHDRETAN